MRRRLLFLALLSLACAPQRTASPGATVALAPVEARRGDFVDDYHGARVEDPYRWLEDADSEETHAWVAAQQARTAAFFAKVPERAAIRRRLEQVWNFERWGVPEREGGRYFFSRNDGLQNQAVLCVADSLSAAPRILLDPNRLSADGTVALKEHAISRDGARVCYGLSSAGSDWTEFRVRDVATGRDFSDRLRWIKFSGAAWNAGGSGFWYSRYPQPEEKDALRQVNVNQRVYFHRLGTPQESDPLVYERPDHKEWGFSPWLTEDGRYLALGVWEGSSHHTGFFYRDLQAEGGFVELLNAFDASWSFLGNDGPVFWFQTDLEAPRGRVIAIDTDNPARENWKELIPQGEDALEEVSVVGDRFVVRRLKDAHAVVEIHRLDGTREKSIPLPGLGSVYGFHGKRTDRETFFTFSSFSSPGTVCRYDFDTGAVTPWKEPRLTFRPQEFVVEQHFCRSRDKTRVPIFVAHRKGLLQSGIARAEHPTILYGYGGFNVNMTPWFSSANLVWMQMGGVYAMAVLRGGGEYGEEWHQAGMKTKKQNVFDDFIAAAEWLIDNGYTSQRRLAIQGESNGGLLVAACMTQRPELFGAALPGVGVMDMLRFHKFTIGWAWAAEYGSSDDPEEFRALRAYSPLHNLRAGVKYPATLISTADHDDRVVPGHSFKFAAALQAAQGGPAPILARIETRAGHGGGKPTSRRIDEVADQFAFLLRALDFPLPGDFR